MSNNTVPGTTKQSHTQEHKDKTNYHAEHKNNKILVDMQYYSQTSSGWNTTNVCVFKLSKYKLNYIHQPLHCGDQSWAPICYSICNNLHFWEME